MVASGMVPREEARMSGKIGGERVINIEPMIQIEFSKYGAFAHRHWPSGHIEEMSVKDAMKEFDKLACVGTFNR